MSDNQSDNSDAWGQARAAIAQQPEAWGVETEDGAMLMVFLDRAEAATYCDGAEPVALGRIGGAAIAQPAEPAQSDEKCSPDGLRYKLPPISMTGHQLRQALQFCNDDLDTELHIALRPAGDSGA